MTVFDTLAREYAAEITARCEALAETGELPYVTVTLTSIIEWLGSDAPRRVRNIWDDVVAAMSETTPIPRVQVASNVLDRLHHVPEVHMYASNIPCTTLVSPYRLTFTSTCGVNGYVAN